jgi:hypothetical protein
MSWKQNERFIGLTHEEASEIINDMSVSDHESQANLELVRSIANKINEIYPNVLENCEWMLTAGDKT